MPTIYLSPSTQEFNEYVIGGTEEEYANKIADAIIPYLRSTGIAYKRNTPEMTAASSIRQSNEGNYDFHFAIHSNAAPPSNAGNVRGVDVYYYPTSTKAKRAATVIANNFKYIYPNPELVKTVTATNIGEVSKTKAPAVLIEVGYHDNPQDALWIKNNIKDIARNLSMSLADYFDIPFVQPQPVKTGIVTASSLNIRTRPNTKSSIIKTVPKGTKLTITGRTDGWYVVDLGGFYGYAFAQYVRITS